MSDERLGLSYDEGRTDDNKKTEILLTVVSFCLLCQLGKVNSFLSFLHNFSLFFNLKLYWCSRPSNKTASLLGGSGRTALPAPAADRRRYLPPWTLLRSIMTHRLPPPKLIFIYISMIKTKCWNFLNLKKATDYTTAFLHNSTTHYISLEMLRP